MCLSRKMSDLPDLCCAILLATRKIKGPLLFGRSLLAEGCPCTRDLLLYGGCPSIFRGGGRYPRPFGPGGCFFFENAFYILMLCKHILTLFPPVVGESLPESPGAQKEA